MLNNLTPMTQAWSRSRMYVILPTCDLVPSQKTRLWLKMGDVPQLTIISMATTIHMEKKKHPTLYHGLSKRLVSPPADVW